MNPKIKKYLFDIQESINSIFKYLGDKGNFSLYEEDKKLRRAVERELEIIGEAISKILDIDNGISISNARKIVDLRNWVIHGYDKVDSSIIWSILVKDLPKLKLEIEKLLEK
ncbi:MAG: HepT-like ribonuclease domain-containing protein [Patescibacteria group bacterium]|nr:DUF86 domain-containing protein [Patescibacteria group bacterium]